jgi:hypothetical protein
LILLGAIYIRTICLICDWDEINELPDERKVEEARVRTETRFLLVLTGVAWRVGVAAIPQTTPQVALLVFMLLLAAAIPKVVRLNSQFGLPGAPFWSARWSGKTFPAPTHPILITGILWGLLLAAVGLTVTALRMSFAERIYPWRVATQIATSHKAALVLRTPTLIVQFGAMSITAICSGIVEEILVRMTLTAMIALCMIHTIRSRGFHRPTGLDIAFITIVQAYIFGLSHLPWHATLLRFHICPLLAVLTLPQFYAGIVLETVYLKRSLEVSIVAHITMNLVLIIFALLLISAGHPGFNAQ